MCLSVKKPIRLVASKDITVIKMVFTNIDIDNNLGFITPYRSEPIRLNDTQVPHAKPSLSFHKYNETEGCYGIGKGYVHSFLTQPLSTAGRREGVFYKAVIPKGTVYFTNNLCTSIASEKLFITDEQYTEADQTLLKNSIETVLLDRISALQQRTYKTHSGIHIGDCILEDGSRISPITAFNENLHSKVVGLVESISNGRDIHLYKSQIDFDSGKELLCVATLLLHEAYNPKRMYDEFYNHRKKTNGTTKKH